MRRFEKKLWALMSGRFCILHLSLVTIMTLSYVITTQHSSKVSLFGLLTTSSFQDRAKHKHAQQGCEISLLPLLGHIGFRLQWRHLRVISDRSSSILCHIHDSSPIDVPRGHCSLGVVHS